MSTNKNTEFLELYKRFETLLRNSRQSSVLDYEGTLETEDSERLKVLRILRNYMTHHDDGMTFVDISDEMFKTLTRMYIEADSGSVTVKDLTTKIKPVLYSANISEASSAMTKSRLRVLPVTDSKGELIGILTEELLIAGFTKASSLKTKLSSAVAEQQLKKTLKDYTPVSPQQKAEEVPYGTKAIVMDSRNKYCGFIDWNKV